MNRDDLAIANCIMDVAGKKDNWTDTEFGRLNVHISETLGVELRDYARSVDDALSLIPEGWGAEITWGNTPKQSSVVLSAPNPDVPGTRHQCVSYALRNGVKVHYPLPISICLAALNVHLHIRERARNKAERPAVTFPPKI
jgi:hypothetical protein